MTLPFLILRPADGASVTEARAREMGLNAIVDPLFQVEPIEWSCPAADQFDALLLTSANAVQHAGDKLAEYITLPVLAVGQATARTAEKAGFNVAEIGNTNAQALLDSLHDHRYHDVLWLAGKQYSGLKSIGLRIETITVYESVAKNLGEEAQICLSNGAVVAVHSRRAANVLNDEMDRLRLDKSINHIVCFSQAIADAAGAGWRSVAAAPAPTDEALLSIAARLCDQGK